MIPNSEHGPEWALPLSLLRSASAFDRDMIDDFWVGEMLRRFALKNPKLDEVSMALDGWILILTRQATPNDVKPLQAEWSIQKFLRSAERADKNPWGIVSTVVPLRRIGSTVINQAKYRVTRILPPEIQIERLFPAYKETEAYKKFAAARDAYRKRILTAEELQAIVDQGISSLDGR